MQLRQMPQPLCASPATRVPTAYLAATFSDALRSSATATTSPAHSWPMTAGKVGGQKPGNLPATILGSVPQMATALTRQRISSPFGSGVGTSWISKSFGPLRTSAFMVFGMSVIVSPLSVEPGKRCLVDGRGETPRLLGRRSVVRQRQDLRGEPAFVVDVVERRGHLRGVDVAYAGRPAVAVDDVEVAEVLSGCAYRRPYRDLLDVHVEHIEEDADAGAADALHGGDCLGGSVEQRRLVAVDGLDDEAAARRGGAVDALLHTLDETPDGRVQVAVGRRLSAHEADDKRRVERCCMLRQLDDALDGASPPSLVGVGQGETVLEERPAAAERREAEACVAQQVLQLAPADLRRRAHADLDAFEAELARHESRLAHATGEQHRAEARGPRRGREARRPAHAGLWRRLPDMVVRRMLSVVRSRAARRSASSPR